MRFTLHLCLILILSWIFFCPSSLLSQENSPTFILRIDAPSSADESFARQFIDAKSGENFDPNLLEMDRQRLENLRFWRTVTLSIRDSMQIPIATLHLKKNNTFLPEASFGGASDYFWWQLGANEYHWRGRGQSLGGYYRYEDRSSFGMHIKAPYGFGRHWGYSVGIYRHATREPGEVLDGANDFRGFFDVDRWDSRLTFHYHPLHRLKMGWNLVYLDEQYLALGEETDRLIQAFRNPTFRKLLTGIDITWDQRNYMGALLSGYQYALQSEVALTRDDGEMFWKVIQIISGYWRLPGMGNLAIRSQVGIAENQPSPFVPFVLDDDYNVRGSGRRAGRGTGELSLNLEYRQVLVSQRSFSIQSVVFFDGSAWRLSGGQWRNAFDAANSLYSWGIGGRVYIPYLNHLILRLDMPIRVDSGKARGVVIGVGQYF